MFIVAERINSSRKAINEAIKAQDADFIRAEAKAQAGAGANYIDVNAGSFVGLETEYLCWLVKTVQGAIELPLCLDSPDPAAIAAALEVVKGPVMVNSITLEKQRLAGMLPLVKKYQTKVVVLCQSDEGMANTVSEKVNVAKQVVEVLTREGVARDDIYIDPLIYPIATDTQSAIAALGAIREIMQLFPGVHTICGLTNVSFGLPLRKLINRTFLVMAVASGLEAAIMDPLDKDLMDALISAELLLNRHIYCASFLDAYRKK